MKEFDVPAKLSKLSYLGHTLSTVLINIDLEKVMRNIERK
jgi:hypothetical protein